MNPDGAFGYSVQLPEKGCWNCACSGFPVSAACSRLVARFTLIGRPCDPAVSECGICRGWISRETAKAYAGASSAEEAAIRRDVLSDGSYTDELDNAMCEKKATPKMLEYAAAIRAAMHPYSRDFQKLTDFPLDADVFDDQPFVRFRFSNAFWPVHEWLRENEPAYLDFKARRSESGAIKAAAWGAAQPRPPCGII